MHATLEQLLEIKDGLENSASVHVQDCLLCRAELESLTAIAEQIETSAVQALPADGWQRIQQAVSQPLPFATASKTVPEELLYAPGRSRWNSLTAAVYTLAFSVLVTGLLTFFNSKPTVDPASPGNYMHASLNQLMLSSRGLESVLQRASIQDALLSDEERRLVDRLHWRLTYLDQMIHENNISNEADPARVENLWTERVDTLTELNQLYYQAQYALVDPDI